MAESIIPSRRQFALGISSTVLALSVGAKRVPAAARSGAQDATSMLRELAQRSGNGATVEVPSGDWWVGEKIDFPQHGLRIRFQSGARLIQRPGSRNLDSLLLLRGDDGEMHGAHVDGAASRSPDNQGRGELVKVQGSRWLIEDMYATGTAMGAHAFALYVVGSHCTVRRFRSERTGRGALRNKGDYNRFEQIDMRSWALKGFVMDAQGGRTRNQVTIDGLVAISGAPRAECGLLIDPDQHVLDRALISNVHVETPNTNSAANVKFAYVREVSVFGLRSIMAANAHRCSLRFQQQVERIDLHDCVIDANINFDATVPAQVRIGTGSRIAVQVIAASAIQDLWGSLEIEDDVTLRAANQFIMTDQKKPGAENSNIALGRLRYIAAGDHRPALIRRGGRLVFSSEQDRRLRMARPLQTHNFSLR